MNGQDIKMVHKPVSLFFMMFFLFSFKLSPYLQSLMLHSLQFYINCINKWHLSDCISSHCILNQTQCPRVIFQYIKMDHLFCYWFPFSILDAHLKNQCSSLDESPTYFTKSITHFNLEDDPSGTLWCLSGKFSEDRKHSSCFLLWTLFWSWGWLML